MGFLKALVEVMGSTGTMTVEVECRTLSTR